MVGHGHPVADAQPALLMARRDMTCMEDVFLFFQLKACGLALAESAC